MKSHIITLLLLSFITLLFACATPLKQVIVSPDINIASSNAFQQKQVQIRFSDLRSSNHIVEILRIGEAAQLYSPQQTIVSVVEASLTLALKANGLQIQPLAANQVEVFIDNALISVHQDMLKYGASNQMNFRVVINNEQGTLTKSFKVSGTSNGPLKADLAVLERDFNQQLAKLLTQIVQNQELQQFMQ
tara:strand:+ start:55 stop:624 length:570 start_codon:yes stop_codon:yes gene_type:complete